MARRIRVLHRCTENIFLIYPIFPFERETPLLRDELDDVMINLHAFLVNIFGVLDNLAWVLLYEKKLAHMMNSADVGLFMGKTQKEFSEKFRVYLNSNQIKRWHTDYLKNYRDALSHRIPPYVPPKSLNSSQKSQIEKIEHELAVAMERKDFIAIDRLNDEEDKIGEACPFFRRSLSGPVAKNQIERVGLNWSDISNKLINNGWAMAESRDVVCLTADLGQERASMLKVFNADFLRIFSILQEAYGSVALHVQIITDFKTIEEIVGNFLGQWNTK